MKVSWGCFFAIGNVINVPFSFFSLGNTSWTLISAWAMKVSWGGVFLPLGTSLTFHFLFFLPLGMSLTFLFLFFSLGDASWTWILAWILNCKMKRRILFLFRNFCFFFKKWESLNY